MKCPDSCLAEMLYSVSCPCESSEPLSPEHNLVPRAGIPPRSPVHLDRRLLDSETEQCSRAISGTRQGCTAGRHPAAGRGGLQLLISSNWVKHIIV